MHLSTFNRSRYEIEFRFSNWGVELLLFLGLGGCAYLGGGIALAVKTQGKPVRVGSHPHVSLWVEMHGLVIDGVGYAHGVAVGRRTTGSRHKLTGRGGGRAGKAEHGYGSLAHGERAEERKERKQRESGGKDRVKVQGQHESKRKSSRGEKSAGEDKEPDPSLLVRQDDGGDNADGGSTAAEPAAAAAAVGVASAGGGRWVHVPT